ncbi:hypothetical protein JMJ56_31455 [Belnapia sp. T18]|uniref:Uncharacterized protein n=1 Tax=Belnapia arida TaxID=2804533 RepID=A0ABS1UD89_9PROT|nr:hypothetical protein [Belnapia arida]MBL6082485.1 hypothetical protein [Belnapia arida]
MTSTDAVKGEAMALDRRHLIWRCRCGAMEGKLHRPFCDSERCGECGGQFLYCDCPPQLRSKRRRVPFIHLSEQCCARCADPHAEMFDVPNKVWAHYVLALGEGDQWLCFKCFETIADLIDGGAYAREHGGAVMLRNIKPNAPEGSEGRKRWDERWSERAHLTLSDNLTEGT